MCDEDIHAQHRVFQYQLIGVDDGIAAKLAMAAKGVAAPNGVWMDDLYGTLGTFSFYAAIDSYTYFRLRPGRTRLTIYGVSIYMRDAFTFLDRTRGTQYLGHWNKTGFILVPAAIAVGEISASDRFNFVAQRNDTASENNIYYPVRNKDYREWQLKHRQGGDLILYSDKYRVPMRDHVVMEFDQ